MISGITSESGISSVFFFFSHVSSFSGFTILAEIESVSVGFPFLSFPFAFVVGHGVCEWALAGSDGYGSVLFLYFYCSTEGVLAYF
jgi:hypothetical protein